MGSLEVGSNRHCRLITLDDQTGERTNCVPVHLVLLWAAEETQRMHVLVQSTVLVAADHSPNVEQMFCVLVELAQLLAVKHSTAPPHIPVKLLYRVRKNSDYPQ